MQESIEIVLYGDPVLRQAADPVEDVDGEVRALAEGMVRALTLKKGYGLAAPQVGVSKRLIVLDVNDYFEIVINPEIVSASDEVVTGVEGCLSIPGGEAEVARHQSIRVRGQTLEGEPFELEACDLLARVFQHEIDHLNGVLFIDHVGEAQRLQVLKDHQRALRQMEDE